VQAAKGLLPEIERMKRGLRVMKLAGRAWGHHFGVKDGATLGLKGDEPPHP